MRRAVVILAVIECFLFASFNLAGRFWGPHHPAVFTLVLTQMPGIAAGNMLAEILQTTGWVAFAIVGAITILSQTVILSAVVWGLRGIMRRAAK